GDGAVKPGDHVAAFCALGGFAEVAVAPEFFTFPLGTLNYAQGAALVLNYHTAYFALKLRGRLKAGETVLVHGAAGGVGTAALQVAKGLGARTIAVVGAGWGAYVMGKPQLNREIGAAIMKMVADGVVAPVVGERFPLERASDALLAIDERRATGKVVLQVRA